MAIQPNNTQTNPNGNADAAETPDSIQFCNKMFFPLFGLTDRICANPLTGKGWIIKPHREGFKVTHPELREKFGWWVVYRSNVAGTNVDVPPMDKSKERG